MGRDRSRGAMRAALTPRDFRLLIGGQAISNTGDWLESVALALGPAIGGILLVLGSPAVAFGVNAATFVVSAAFTFLIRTTLVPTAAIGEAAQSFGARVSAGFKAIRSSPAVRALLAMS